MPPLGHSIWEALDFGAWYAQHPFAIDGMIYLVLGLGVARVGLGRHFEGRGGVAVIAAMGTALALGATTAARAAGFTLGELGPVAWSILLLLLGFLVYGLLRRVHCPRAPASGAVLLLVAAIASSLGNAAEELLRAMGLAAGIGVLAVVGVLLFIGWALTLALNTASNPHTHPDPHYHRPQWTMRREGLALPADNERRAAAGGCHWRDELMRIRRRVERFGIDDGLTEALHGVRSGSRPIDGLYAAALERFAAAARMPRHPSPWLARRTRILLAACQENISRYREALTIALTATRTQHTDLLLEAIGRLVDLEREADDLLRQLDEVMQRSSEQPDGGRAGAR